MAKLVFYGGVKIIGGNCVILEDDGSRIMLDNGMCFSKENKYYRNFLNSRGPNDIRDYLILDLIPKIKGIYGKRHITDPCIDELDAESHYIFKEDLESYEEYKKQNGQPFIEAMLLSHAHLDHFRNIVFMPKEIPIICSDITHHLLKIISDLNDKVDYLNYMPYECGKKGGYFPGRKKNKVSEKRSFKIIKPYEVIKIEKFEIVGYPVDHSIPGAMAYKIKTSNGKEIVYTGDIRFHGHQNERKLSEEFVNKVSSTEIDVLISEGTKIDDSNKISEEDVYNNVLNNIKKDVNISSKLIFTAFPWKSVTRFRTVYNIACDLNRIFVIQPKLAYTLHNLQNFKSLEIKDILAKDNIRIYKPRKDSMTYADGDYVKSKECLSWDTKWSEKKKGGDFDEILYANCYGNDKFTKAYELHLDPSKYIMHLDFYNLNELIDIRPPVKSHFYNLKTEPFSEEGRLDLVLLKKWMELFDLNCNAKFHASGHASGPEIIKMIKIINPKLVFPIHTEHPELFNFPNTEKTIIPGREYLI